MDNNNPEQKRKKLVSPSLLAANQAKLADCVRQAGNWRCNAFHIDIMDGNYVNDFGFSPRQVKAISEVTDLPLDIHLMINNPARYISAFADAGASCIVFQMETEPHIDKSLREIKKLGLEAGIALAPATSLHALKYIIAECDWITVMSVNPGTAGSAFIPYTYRKIRDLSLMIKEKRLKTRISVDGGIGVEEAGLCFMNGADKIIAGTSIFNSPDPQKVILEMSNSAGPVF